MKNMLVYRTKVLWVCIANLIQIQVLTNTTSILLRIRYTKHSYSLVGKVGFYRVRLCTKYSNDVRDNYLDGWARCLTPCKTRQMLEYDLQSGTCRNNANVQINTTSLDAVSSAAWHSFFYVITSAWLGFR